MFVKIIQTQQKAHKALTPNRTTTKPTVLIVDDDPMLTRLITSVFDNDQPHFDPVIAKNGSEAMAMLEARPIHAVVTDLNMPGVDGAKLLGYLKDHFPQIPCAVMTGHSIEKNKYTSQVKEFIQKPFDPSVLYQTILALLGLDFQLSGKITGISISTFLQIVEVEKKTGLVKIVSADGTEGKFFFKNGELLDATFGKRSGTEAALAMLLIESTPLSLHRLPIPEPRKVVQESIVNLMLLASRIADEEERNRALKDAGETPPECTQSKSGLQDPQIKMLISPIKNLRKEFKLLGIAILDGFDTVCYASCNAAFLKPELMTSFIANLTHTANLLENEDVSATNEVLWTTSKCVLIARKTKVMANLQFRVLIACAPGPHTAILRTKLKHTLEQTLPAIFKTQEFLSAEESPH